MNKANNFGLVRLVFAMPAGACLVFACLTLTFCM